ncbi:GTP-binding protein HflX [Desulfonispora thiosulfatigenes DSM 11270]|uniref:GTPase HflX n=1 Tax=Desulfonispora thiosulfatigenes DSM 11270 TaxID=656914 RepID=A0A1W1VPB5_DESTI|nr:GTPase HflX [Desulfonispora thiosulfatigenes]SMB95197.1 GTP-binding protein HflX [Desulfonispora thiosulfatigenes DSM 11270]
MCKCHGEIGSLNKRIKEELNSFFDYKILRNQIISLDLIESMVTLTREIKKEIAVCIDNKGKVIDVIVGEKSLVEIPSLWVKRDQLGLSGVRCIHTHPSGDSSLSDADLSTLTNLHLDCIVALGINDSLSCSIAYPINMNENNQIIYEKKEHLTTEALLEIPFEQIILDFNKNYEPQGLLVKEAEEKALLVVVDWSKETEEVVTESAEELKNLATTAGLIVSETIIQKRDRPDSLYFIGKGKLQEISLYVQQNNIDCVIFDDMLSPSQQNNLMDVLKVKVLDRTSLILDIFAQRAKTKEGKLQVQLAQLNYLLPRLTGKGISMSRLGGGVGTRGPGETKLETDRRYIKRLIHNIETQLKEVKKQRQIHIDKRKNNNVPVVALVGYTNAGKSSLLNILADENVLAENKLFATLDPVTRKVVLDNNQEVLLTDTVGFIKKLPHQLISAFRATLEEIIYADLLLHVVDITNENYEMQIKTVNNVLKEIGVTDIPTIYVYNKVDLLSEIPPINSEDSFCYLSTKTGVGIEDVKNILADHFFTEKKYEVLIPYTEGKLIEKIHNIGTVDSLSYEEEGTLISFTSFTDNVDLDILKHQK